MQLKALGRYQNEPRQIDVHPGDVIEVKDELGAWLLADAPGTFEDPNAPKDAAPAAEQQPFDRAPDGTTNPMDATPPVVTGPDSGVDVVHAADADEQQQVLDEQAEKAVDAPPVDKQIKRAPKAK